MRLGISIDGGGIRGLIPAIILQRLEENLNAKAMRNGIRDPRIALTECVDMLYGTSTGGILALGMAHPDVDFDFPSMVPLVALYQDKGPSIFGAYRWQGWKGLKSYQYASDPLARELRRVLGHTLMHEARCPVGVTSYNTKTRKPRFFKSWRKDRDARMVDAALATSAAWPTYFIPHREPVLQPARLHKLDGSVAETTTWTIPEDAGPLIDGGFVGNTPCAFTNVDMSAMFPDEHRHVISIGTGEAAEPLEWDEMRDGGLIRHGGNVVDVLFDASSDAMLRIVDQDPDATLYRLQPTLENASHAMDNVERANMLDLVTDAHNFVENHPQEIAAVVDVLWARYQEKTT